LCNSNTWLDYIEQSIGKIIRNQFERAVQRHGSSNLLVENLFQFERAVQQHGSSNLLVENVVAKEVGIIRPDEYYFGLSTRMQVVGRNEDEARDVALDLIDGRVVDWGKLQFFTNPLRPVDEDHPDYRSPSRRVVCGPAHVFTFEFDESDLAFFAEQCRWFRFKGRDLNCPMGEVYSAFSEHPDFLGLVACYSGNKSFHLHVVFDTILARAAFKLDGPEVNLRNGFMAHWRMAKEVVVRILQPTVAGHPVEPDAKLQHPEWYRRLPGGSRLIEPKKNRPDWKHALGIPFQTRVPQVIMWQKFRKQAAKDAGALFFRPAPFRSEKAIAAKARNSGAVPARSVDGFSADEFAFIEEQMRGAYPTGTYPEFVDLVKQSGIWSARFRNNATDRNPSSIMRQDHSRVLVMGRASGSLAGKTLPQPLLAMMRLWKAQYIRMLTKDAAASCLPAEKQGPNEPQVEDLELILPTKHVPGTTAYEATFATGVTDLETTGKETRRFLRRILPEHSCILIKGPEGGGKSSAITKLHDSLTDWLSSRGKPVLALYVASDYVGAEEKCCAFNRAEAERQARRGPKRSWRDRDYKGVVLPSFSRAYKAACDDLGLFQLSPLEAAQHGCKSIWEAIQRLQPEVLHHFRDQHRRLWDEIGTAQPVFFSVHAVAHGWRTATPTRTMWARRFWESGGDPFDWRLREDTELGLLIHDEIKHTDIVDIRRAEEVEWVQRLIDAEPEVWNGESGSLYDQCKAYDRWTGVNPGPQIDGQHTGLTFEEVRSFVAGGMLDWTEVTLRADGAYPDVDPKKLLYTRPVADGHRWMVRTRYWWRDNRTPTGQISRSKVRVADRVIVLTTEELPAAVLRVADPICWSIFALETPEFGRDLVDVETDRGVTSNNVAKAAQKHRARLGGAIAIISNKAKPLSQSQTPISARGSNRYIGEDLLQTMMFTAPHVHEQMLVLNAYTGRDDCLLLHHMDEFNQTCGRNLGYRRRRDVRHHLLVHPRLFEFLVEKAAWAWARYDIVLHLTKRQRISIRSAYKRLASETTSGALRPTTRDEFGFILPEPPASAPPAPASPVPKFAANDDGLLRRMTARITRQRRV
jgi:hypothetical protein